MATAGISAAADEGRQHPAGQGLGIVVPYDFALDRELWRWTPSSVSLHLTRTAYQPLPVGIDQAHAVAAGDTVAHSVRALSAIEPAAVAYGCTSGSFSAGMGGERALRATMEAAGAPVAVSTSGALVAALQAIGARRIVVATPYDAALTSLLVDFVAEAGIEVAGARHLGLDGEIWTVDRQDTADLIRSTASQGADAVFVSCTNLATYDLIAPLEKELGVPILTANQVTMWMALSVLGVAAVGRGQSLLTTTPAEGGTDVG